MIDEAQSNDYLLQVEKLMSSDVNSTYWSHNMDLLVIVTVDNLLELYRINFKAQKVFQVEEEKPITSVSFSPDSQFIAYGTNDGQIKVLKTQNGESLLTVNDPINEQIRSFSFGDFCKYPISRIFPFKQKNLLQKLILQISPHKNCNKTSIVKLNYFNELTDQDNFTMLVSSSQKCTSLHLNGFITIAQVSYDMIAAKHFSGNNFQINYSHFNPQSQCIQSVLVQSTVSKYILHFVEFQCTTLKQLQPDIIKFNCLMSYVSQILAFVEQAYPAAEVLLRDILRQYNSKMNLIDDPDQENINPCTELFKYLNCGITSPAMINFLTKEVYDTKVLQKLDETINSVFNSLHDLMLQSIQNSLQRAYLLVQQLKNLCELDKYKEFGVKYYDLKKIQQQIEKLYTMGQILLVQSTQAKFDIRNLLVWLNKAAIKTSSDPNVQIQNTKSYLSRYTVDFTRLHQFLDTQDSFKLANLTQFFSKGNESHYMNIPDCQFRLLNRINNSHTVKSPAYISKTKQIQKLLQIEDIQINPELLKMQIQLNYKSFRLELKLLKDDWKILKVKPIIEVSKSIESSYNITKIGEVQASQMFLFDIKTFTKNNEQKGVNELLLYFIERSNQGLDKVVCYNTVTRKRRHIVLPVEYQAHSLSVGADVILLTENPSNLEEEKSIIQVVNQEWQGEQLQIGKSIHKLSGQIMLNAGLRGLNLMIINKNKLVVFD